MAISAVNPRDERKLESTAIINALRRGTVPKAGLSRLAVGLNAEEHVISAQLSFAAAGHADCKFVRGDYGSGKTFLISRASEIGIREKFVISHVVISPDTPLHKLQAVYAKICTGLCTATEEHALKSIIDTWIYGIEERLISTGISEDSLKLTALTEKEIESVLERVSGMNSGLAAALRTYYAANIKGDFAAAQAAIGWISGESTVGRSFKTQAGIKGSVSETDALYYLRGLVYIMIQAGYSGLVVTFDEVETIQAFSRPLREKGFINLRQIVDMIDKNELPNCFFLFAGTPAFFDSSRGMRSLPPLYDRIGIISDDGFANPMQTQIVLSKFNEDKLASVSNKVMEIYAEAYGQIDKNRVTPKFIRSMIEKVTGRFGGRVDVVPRLYLREFIDVLDKCALYENYIPEEKYAFAPKTEQTELKEEEKAVMEVEW